MNKPAKPFTDTSPDWVACSDEHTPSHEEIYEMAVQDKADDMDIKALSDAATGGTWHGVGYMVETDNDNAADPASCSAAMYGQDRITDHDEQCANATFIAALVNLYRSGDLLPRADLSPVGTVRKLVWDDRQSANPHMHYRVHIGYGVEYGHFNLTYCGSTIGEYSSETEAKAAAQAHHDAYILSQGTRLRANSRTTSSVTTPKRKMLYVSWHEVFFFFFFFLILGS